MSTPPLRARLIRLAHTSLELRPHLLPLLKQAGYNEWKETITGSDVRIRWKDHPDNEMLIEELPTKPLKRQLRRVSCGTDGMLRWSRGSAFLMTNLVRDMKPSSSMSFDRAVSALRQALESALEVTMSEHKGYTRERAKRDGFEWMVREDTVFFLEVEPHDYAAMSVEGKDFVVSSEWGKFKAYSPSSFPEDDPNTHGGDPHYTGVSSSAPAGARKLFKLLKADPTALRNISYNGFSDWLRTAKIPYDSFASSWH